MEGAAEEEFNVPTTAPFLEKEELVTENSKHFRCVMTLGKLKEETHLESKERHETMAVSY